MVNNIWLLLSQATPIAATLPQGFFASPAEQVEPAVNRILWLVLTALSELGLTALFGSIIMYAQRESWRAFRLGLAGALSVSCIPALLSFGLPVLAGYSVNGVHRCKEGGAMQISGWKGRVSSPTVVFKGVKYTMRPYMPPGATYDTFVADNQSGIELGVGQWLSLTNGRGSICTSKDWYS